LIDWFSEQLTKGSMPVGFVPQFPVVLLLLLQQNIPRLTSFRTRC